MIRDILGFVIAIMLAAWILSFVVGGFRTGRIHHTDSTSTFSFRKQPFRFLFVVVLFMFFGAMLIYCAIGRAIAIWHKLSA
jgi:hypothetical protein